MKRLLTAALSAMSVCAFAGTLTIGQMTVLTNYVSGNQLGGWSDAYGDSTLTAWSPTIGWPGDFGFVASTKSGTLRTGSRPYSQGASTKIEGYWVVQYTLYWTESTAGEGAPGTIYCHRWNSNYSWYDLQASGGQVSKSTATESAAASVNPSPFTGSSVSISQYFSSYDGSYMALKSAAGNAVSSFAPAWSVVQILGADGRKRYMANSPQYKLSDCSSSTSTLAVSGGAGRVLQSSSTAQAHDVVLFGLQP